MENSCLCKLSREVCNFTQDESSKSLEMTMMSASVVWPVFPLVITTTTITIHITMIKPTTHRRTTQHTKHNTCTATSHTCTHRQHAIISCPYKLHFCVQTKLWEYFAGDSLAYGSLFLSAGGVHRRCSQNSIQGICPSKGWHVSAGVCCDCTGACANVQVTQCVQLTLIQRHACMKHDA